MTRAGHTGAKSYKDDILTPALVVPQVRGRTSRRATEREAAICAWGLYLECLQEQGVAEADLPEAPELQLIAEA